MTQVEIAAGTSFVEACYLLLAAAKDGQCYMVFNGTPYFADEGTTIDVLKAEFNRRVTAVESPRKPRRGKSRKARRNGITESSHPTTE